MAVRNPVAAAMQTRVRETLQLIFHKQFFLQMQ
jgi:hypothetical protein